MKALVVFFIYFFTAAQAQVTGDTKSFAKKVLEDKVQYKDSNEHLFMATLDSLLSEGKKDRHFYFKTANKIQRLADGALGEYFASIAAKYYINRTRDFLRYSLALSKEDIDRWLSEIAFDYAADGQDINNLPQIRKALDNIEIQCQCEKSERERLREYNSILLRKIETDLKSP